MPIDKPVLIELEEEDIQLSPANAPIILDTSDATMQRAARYVARPASRIARLFWGLVSAFLAAAVSVAAWDFVAALIARNQVLGGAVLAVTLGIVALLIILILRELSGLLRLNRIDALQREVKACHASEDAERARRAAARIAKMYKNRADLEWARAEFDQRLSEQFDAPDVLALAEDKLLAPLDAAARLEVEAAARKVATVTTFVPMAFADVLAALMLNLGMIRAIAQVYGGRAGTLGSWRLTKIVLSHLVATGAVSVGDDLIGSIAGGGVMSKISRRFGEGIINGALTARVGIAAMEVCRPMPFVTQKRPRVTTLLQRALTGLFSTAKPAARPEP